MGAEDAGRWMTWQAKNSGRSVSFFLSLKFDRKKRSAKYNNKCCLFPIFIWEDIKGRKSDNVYLYKISSILKTSYASFPLPGRQIDPIFLSKPSP